MDISPVFSGFSFISHLYGLLGRFKIGLTIGQYFIAFVGVNILDDITGKVSYTFQILYCHTQQQADSARRPAQKPNVSYRASQADMPHTFAPDNTLGHKSPAFINGRFAAAQALIFSVVGINILYRTKNAFAK